MAAVSAPAILSVSILLLFPCVFSATQINNITEILPVPTEGVDATKCEFFLVDRTIRDDVNDLLHEGTKLIKFTIKFKDYPSDILVAQGGDLFKPYSWMRSTTAEGKSLLMLDDNFEVLSLTLLGIGVSSMHILLDETPFGCMNQLSWEERENQTRELLFKAFEPPRTSKKAGNVVQDERICNMRVKSSSGRAEFVHHCCHEDIDNTIKCADVERDIWINVLLICVIAIKILVVLYSPSFVPETLYREKFTATRYVHKIPSDKQRLSLKVVQTQSPGSFSCSNPSIKLEMLNDLKGFKAVLNDMAPEKIYDLKLDKIELSAKCSKLLPENYVPVSITKMIYENVFRCKMRSISVLKPCCDTPVCGVMDVGCRVMSWYKCLRILTKMILVAMLSIPWIVRLAIYFTYEAANIDEKRLAAKRQGLGLNFGGNFTLYLTPFHALFLCTYVILTVDSFVYGFLGKGMKNRFKFVLRKCLRDMRERSRLDAYGWAVGLALLPFQKLGILGIPLAPLFWIILLPGIIPVLAFYTFPAVNLTIRLIIHLFIFMCPKSFIRRFNVNHNVKLKHFGSEKFQGKEDMSANEVLMQLAIIIMCLTSFWSMTLLLMECLSFFVEVGVYTLMGIIVNAGATLQYITLLFLIWMYANSSFGAVHKIYLAYHKIIRGQLLAKKKDEMHATAKEDESVQESVAFRVEGNHVTEKSPGISIDVKDGMLRWKTRGLLVFLNKLDQPFTPAKFFFETIDMKYCGCPGKLWHNTLIAFYNFMKIMVFLMFVVIVVLAFGNQFSTTNQMLATLAGGFVPFVFSNFFQKESQAFTIDTESVQFVTELDNTITTFSQKWPVADITPVLDFTTKTGETKELYSERRNGNDLEKINHDDVVNKANNSNKDSTEVTIENDSDKNEYESSANHVDLIVDCSKSRSRSRNALLKNIQATDGSVSMLDTFKPSLSLGRIDIV